jgi:hypothetical protein
VATFGWTVDPPTDLYRRTSFVLRFPASVELGSVPATLWWDVALICLHAHWPLLRPCVIELPIRLPPGEAEFWLRLLDAEVVALEADRRSSDFERRIEIVESGAALPPLARWLDRGRFGTTFSGGKDSLLQAGLLAELTARPLLVTTTSPMPPMHDQTTPRRRQILEAIARRRAVTLVEVESDYRAGWDNDFSRRLGYRVSVNEVTDCLLYFAALLAVAAARGVTHLSLAAQNEGFVTVEWHGRLVQHAQYMYTGVTQRALEALLEPAGVTYASLISPLHDYQAQELLWARYPDLRDLQYSCWRVGSDQAACSACEKCLRTALPALARGDSPAPIGVDLVRLLWSMRAWQPPSSETESLSANDLARWRFESQTARTVATIPVRRVVRALAADSPRHLLSRHAWRAVFGVRAAQRRARLAAPEPHRGCRPAYLRFVDPILRERLGAIYEEHFEPEPEAVYTAELVRNEALADWIIEPLARARDQGVP